MINAVNNIPNNFLKTDEPSNSGRMEFGKAWMHMVGTLYGIP
jgi:hypothetical protein